MDSLIHSDNELAFGLSRGSVCYPLYPHSTGILAMLTKEERDMAVQGFIGKGWTVTVNKSNRCTKCQGTVVTYYGERKCVNCGRRG